MRGCGVGVAWMWRGCGVVVGMGSREVTYAEIMANAAETGVTSGECGEWRVWPAHGECGRCGNQSVEDEGCGS